MTTSGDDLSGGTDFRVADEQHLEENDRRLAEFRRELTSLGEGQALGVDDFAWGQTTLARYQSIQNQVIIVPGTEQHQTPTERIYLMSPYRPSGDQVRGLAVQLYKRDNEQVTNHCNLHFADLERRPIVGITIDEVSDEIRPIFHPDIHLTGYWGCVENCLRNAWRTFPWPLQYLCGGVRYMYIWRKSHLVWRMCRLSRGVRRWMSYRLSLKEVAHAAVSRVQPRYV